MSSDFDICFMLMTFLRITLGLKRVAPRCASNNKPPATLVLQGFYRGKQLAGGWRDQPQSADGERSQQARPEIAAAHPSPTMLPDGRRRSDDGWPELGCRRLARAASA
jgi:hypothetical protein